MIITIFKIFRNVFFSKTLLTYYPLKIWAGTLPGGNQVDGLPPASSTVAVGSQLEVNKMLTYL